MPSLKSVWIILFSVLLGVMLNGCYTYKYWVPRPSYSFEPPEVVAPPDSSPVIHTPQTKKEVVDSLDFSIAADAVLIDEEPVVDSTTFGNQVANPVSSPPLNQPIDVDAARLIEPVGPVSVSTRMVRVLLADHVRSQEVGGAGQQLFVGIASQGRVAITAPVTIVATNNEKRCEVRGSSGQSLRAALPCTLYTAGGNEPIAIDKEMFRHSIIITADGRESVALVNRLPVETYLRGVVPLEIGRVGAADFAAACAQAVAARTYTYRKIQEHTTDGFDLYRTVADQVYGGATAEYSVCDSAIAATRDIVMTVNDSLIVAYYHAVCGGTTAAVAAVWSNKSPVSYLVSRSDCDEQGRAYCSFSKAFSWVEEWSTGTLSKTAARFWASVYSGSPLRGTIEAMTVVARDNSGRIKTLSIKTSRGTWECSGDKSRFILRRNQSGNPVLRSANFKVAALSSNVVRLSGTGYGHGVGLCQCGAMGRSRAGFAYHTILKAYYAGISLKKIRALSD